MKGPEALDDIGPEADRLVVGLVEREPGERSRLAGRSRPGRYQCGLAPARRRSNQLDALNRSRERSDQARSVNRIPQYGRVQFRIDEDRNCLGRHAPSIGSVVGCDLPGWGDGMDYAPCDVAEVREVPIQGSGAVLAATKLHIPGVRPELIARAALIDELASSPHRKLTLIEAPAGYGKTTLIAEWCSSSREQRDFAWLSLDEGDSDPARFWVGVIDALRTLEPGIGAPALEALGSRGIDARDVALPLLLNELGTPAGHRARARRLPDGAGTGCPSPRRRTARPPALGAPRGDRDPRGSSVVPRAPAGEGSDDGGPSCRPPLHGRGGRGASAPHRGPRPVGRSSPPPSRAHGGLAGRPLPGGAVAAGTTGPR